MIQNNSNDVGEDYFNDLSQQLPEGQEETSTTSGGNADQPKAKRIACVLCRKRKLRCDGVRPACGTCKRLTHDCTYDEVRKKSGPKRGYVKLLEQRLQQVEQLIKDHPADQSAAQSQSQPQPQSNPSPPIDDGVLPPLGPINGNVLGHGVDVHSNGKRRVAAFGSVEAQQQATQLPDPIDASLQEDFTLMDATPSLTMGTSGLDDPLAFNWDLIGLGYEEQPPSAKVQEELHQIYFEKIHVTIPMVHRPRYLAAMNMPPNFQPPLALRYMIWCHASAASENYTSLTDIFYQRARKYLHQDEMRGHGEVILSLQHVQAWLLVGLHEFKNMYFPRAWMSAGRACKAAQMMMLHRLDGVGLDVKQCLPPPKDWIEREERRRTFWMAFAEDRYASIGTGWPMTMDEKDIQTNLPANEHNFEMGVPEQTPTLEDALRPGGSFKISAFSGVCLIATMFGRNLHHLHRARPDDDENNLNGPFWQRHHELDGILSHLTLGLPGHLRLPAGIPDPNVIFLNMAIQTSIICLHQAAIFKADRHRLPPNVSAESRQRCVVAAAETSRLMKMICHIDLATMNPFLAFSLYVAARVFVQYLKFRSQDPQIRSSLLFMMTAMHALKRTNSLTESFIVQLEVDLDSANLDIGQRNLPSTANLVSHMERMGDPVKCSPIFEIREEQGPFKNPKSTNPFMPKGSWAGSRVSSVSSDSGNSPGVSAGGPRSASGLGASTHLVGEAPGFQLPMHQKSTPRWNCPEGQRAPTFGDATLTPPSDMDLAPHLPRDGDATSSTGTSGRQNPASENSSHTTPPSDTDQHSPQTNSLNIPGQQPPRSSTTQQQQRGFPSSPAVNNLPTPQFTDPIFNSTLDFQGFDNTFGSNNINFDANFSTGLTPGPHNSQGMVWEVTGNSPPQQGGASGGYSMNTPGTVDEMSWSSMIEEISREPLSKEGEWETAGLNLEPSSFMRRTTMPGK